MNYALIIAGGSGNRMGQDIPKQFMHVENCPIIIHTMRAFQQHADIHGIAVVCLAGWETVVQSYANQFCIDKLKWIFPGGSNGQESIHNGIYGLKEAGCQDDDLVLIHDAVRPLLSQDIISSNIATCQQYGYAITGIKCREAILESEDGFARQQAAIRHWQKVMRRKKFFLWHLFYQFTRWYYGYYQGKWHRYSRFEELFG